MFFLGIYRCVSIYNKNMISNKYPEAADAMASSHTQKLNAILFSKFMMKESFELSISIPEVIKEKVLKRTKEIEGKLKEKLGNFN